MHLIVLRHGDKLSGNNPTLSDFGRKQALLLPKLLQSSRWPSPTKIYSSPKVRTLETVKPLSETLGLTPVSEPRLHQRGFEETRTQFRERLQNWIDDVLKNSGSAACVLACTHVDVCDEMRTLLECPDLADHRFDFWRTAQFVVLNGGETWELIATEKAE